MFEKLIGKFRKAEPAAQREVRAKNYTAQTGYVYEYYLARSNAPAYEFRLSWNRRDWTAQTISVPDECVAEWERANERTMRPQERYAAAKLGLFAHLDELPPEQIGAAVTLTPEQVAALLEPLDL